MKLERKKNAIRNIEIGVLNKTVTIICPFILRTVLIRELGTEYLGLGSLFTSILQVLNLTELGMGSAMVFHLYRPIAEEDNRRICALVSLYKYVYRVIGLIILLGGLLVLPFLPHFIHGQYPDDINIYFLYLLYLVNTVVSYFIASYRSTILSAFQRRDIISMIGMAVHTGLYLMQIVCLLCFANYYVYVIWLPIFTIIENIVTARYVKRKYSNFVKPETIDKQDIRFIFSSVKDLFGHKLSRVVVNSVDTIVISAFLGLQMVTIYNNYYYLMSAVSGLLDIIYQAVLAGIGNSLVSERIEKNQKDFDKFTVLNLWLVGWCAICFLCLYQPMMELWMGETLMLGIETVLLLVVYFYVWKSRQTVLLYKDAAGLWAEDCLRPYAEIIVNLTINILLVQIIGINGVLISTILSMLFVSLPWETRVFFRRCLKCSTRKYYLANLVCLALTFLAGTITFVICNFIPFSGIISFILKIAICMIVPNVVIFCCGYRIPLYHETVRFVASMIPVWGQRKDV
jgi:O-antigen/teichoic acid export membrane protein|nr:oligosaccharide flippase family protein [uncultured Acetatifactor sp.]